MGARPPRRPDLSEGGDGPLWKGRFSTTPASSLARLSHSIGFDRRLWREDITATGAHSRALHRAGVLTAPQVDEIASVLNEAAAAFESGSFPFHASDEDVHSAVERYLIEKLGDLGARIHAGRSRNDLTVTDLRLWLKGRIAAIARSVNDLEKVLLGKAREYVDCVAPGYTHLQRAQPVLLAHHLLAHFFPLHRDFDRMRQAYAATDVSCLGAAAFAGTTLPLDVKATAEDLRFAGVFENSADAVADRDFALQFLSAGAILGVHLSRLGEEIVIWTSHEFRFAALDDAYATGSSIMPQKKNPDAAELVRAKAARISGNLVHLLGVMKGLPLAYNRDLQEDKEPVFDTVDSLSAALGALAGAIETMTFDRERLEAAAGSGNSGATDLAESLVAEGVPFRIAHEVLGKLVASAAAEGKELSQVPAEDLANYHPDLKPHMLGMLDPRTSVNARLSHGGTAPARVAEQIEKAQELIEEQARWLAGTGFEHPVE